MCGWTAHSSEKESQGMSQQYGLACIVILEGPGDATFFFKEVHFIEVYHLMPSHLARSQNVLIGR
jgi:hypothetical protein